MAEASLDSAQPRLYAIVHTETGVIRRATTADPAEVGVGADETVVELPAETKLDLSEKLRINGGRVELAQRADVIAAGLDEQSNREALEQRDAARRAAVEALASIDPAKESLEVIATKVRNYFASL